MFVFGAFASTYNIWVWSGYEQFVPDHDNVQELYVGDTIRWYGGPNLHDNMRHTITSLEIPSGAKAFDKEWIANRDTVFLYVLEKPGVYKYECTPHSPHMAGQFTVMEKTPTAVEELRLEDVFVKSRDVVSVKQGVMNVYSVLGDLITGNVSEFVFTDHRSGLYFLRTQIGGVLYIQKVIVN